MQLPDRSKEWLEISETGTPDWWAASYIITAGNVVDHSIYLQLT